MGFPRPALLLQLCAILSCFPALKVGCIGDSITAGTCSWTTHGFPVVLQRLLGGAFEVRNFGSSGRTLMRHGGPGNASYWTQPAWAAAKAFDADVYTVLLGTNDAKLVNAPWVRSNYTRDYLDLVSTLRGLPSNPRLFLVTSPPLYPSNPYHMDSQVINVLLPSLVAEVASAAGDLPVVGVFQTLGGSSLTRPNLFCDGVHPNDAGYVEIANAVYRAMVETLSPLMQWPAFKPASPEQVQGAEARPEWNPTHPELFLHRPSIYQSFSSQSRERFEKQRMEKWLRYVAALEQRKSPEMPWAET